MCSRSVNMKCNKYTEIYYSIFGFTLSDYQPYYHPANKQANKETTNKLTNEQTKTKQRKQETKHYLLQEILQWETCM